MYVLTSYVWTLQNYKKFIDYQTQRRGYCHLFFSNKLYFLSNHLLRHLSAHPEVFRVQS